MKDWFRRNATVIGAITGGATLTTTIIGSLLYLAVTKPMNQRFDAVNQHFDAIDQRFKTVDQRFDDLQKRMEQGFTHAKEAREQDFTHLSQRFDAQDRRIEDLANGVSEIRRLTVSIGEHVSRNEKRISIVEQRLQTADTPSP